MHVISVYLGSYTDRSTMQAAQNQLLMRVGPGTPCGDLMRRYWQPVALLDEFDPRFDPRMAQRPLKAVRLLGQDLALFRDNAQRWSLLDRSCPHRGADLVFARHSCASSAAPKSTTTKLRPA